MQVPSDMAGVRCYDSCPVDRKDRSIRLLRIRETSSPALIGCDMTCLGLEFCVYPFLSFAALSYTWGSIQPTHVILVNHIPCSIQQNLWEFLDEGRKLCTQESYWIDALCIDQSNTDERNHQVSLMQDIYLSASVVYVWLGSGTSSSDVAMDHINSSHTERDPLASLDLWSGLLTRGIADLAYHPYWNRIWIVQEIMLARRILFVYGTKTATWVAMRDFFIKGSHTGEKRSSRDRCLDFDTVRTSPATRIIKGKSHCAQIAFDSKAHVLGHLITTYENLESTEVLDKVYGFLGLVELFQFPRDRFSVPVDYALPAPQLLLTVYDLLQVIYDPLEKLDLAYRLMRLLRVDPRNPFADHVRTDALSQVR